MIQREKSPWKNATPDLASRELLVAMLVTGGADSSRAA
jgi:hypothetical protein